MAIGILIALQINNNKNYNTQRNLEQEFIMSLQSEFETNLDNINASIQENEQRVEALSNLIILFVKNVLVCGPNINWSPIAEIIYLHKRW